MRWMWLRDGLIDQLYDSVLALESPEGPAARGWALELVWPYVWLDGPLHAHVCEEPWTLARPHPAFMPDGLLDLRETGEVWEYSAQIMARSLIGATLPRLDSPAAVAALRRPLPMFVRLGMAKMPGRVSLRTPDGKTLASAGRGPAVTITGEVPELLMFAFGRNEVHADFAGDPDTVAAVKGAPRGV